MKRVLLGLLLSFFVLTSRAQKIYFVYLQSETETSFVVKMNDKVYPSSASGYLVLPRLRDSTYTIRIGFPNNKFPEQQFAISIRATDHGYLIKNFPDKGGWGLFDLQTAAVIMAGQGSASYRTEPKQISPFTEVLSAAVDDPSLKLKTILLEAKKTETIATEVAVTNAVAKDTAAAELPLKPDTTISTVSKKKVDTAELKKEAVAINTQVADKTDSSAAREIVKTPVPVEVTEPVKKDTTAAIIQASYSPSKVTRKSESSGSEGLGVVYTDDYRNGNKDTVRIIIPNPKPGSVVLEEVKQKSIPVADKKIETPKQEIATAKKEEKVTVVPVASGSDKSARGTTKSITSSNVSCKAIASEKEYVKLRKKLVAARTEDDMINESKKDFDTRCYSTEHIKALGSLFLREAGRFQFYEAAWPHNSDRENFIALQQEFKDPYFIHRFKNLVN